MADNRPLPLWAGRTAALLGILLVALNLRTAVAAVGPIVSDIRADIALDSVGIGAIGAVPPIAFALSGLFGVVLARKFGLERLLVVSIGAIVAGHLIRGTAGSYSQLFIGTVVVFAGVGVGNVLLPPLVKRYFPDRIGLLTTAYVSMMAISTAGPAALAAPISAAAGWRVSLGVWGVVAVSSIVPWLAVIGQHRRDRARRADAAAELSAATHHLGGGLWRSRTAWAIALIFALSSVNAYAAFVWLPPMLIDIAGLTPVQAGGLLAVFSIIGLPVSLVVPVLVTRLRNVSGIVYLGVASFVLGYSGLLIAPAVATPLWVAFAGLGALLFPAALVLINLRTRTEVGSTALSGFVHAVGYSIAIAGPLAIGVLHDVSGGWTLPLATLIVVALACVVPGAMLSRPAFVEDELAR